MCVERVEQGTQDTALWGSYVQGVECRAPLWRASAELRAGRHRTPSQDSTVSALSQSLPVCWVTGNGREELAGVTLAAPFPLTRGYECLFLSGAPRLANLR